MSENSKVEELLTAILQELQHQSSRLDRMEAAADDYLDRMRANDRMTQTMLNMPKFR